MIKESCETSQLSFRLSVNAEDIHLGPVVNGEGLTHGPLADQLALGFVHDPGQRDLGRGDTPVGAGLLLEGGFRTLQHGVSSNRHIGPSFPVFKISKRFVEALNFLDD